MDYIARVNPRYFAALHHLADTNDVRFFLNGITLERHAAGGVVMIATSGHVLGVMHDSKGWMADGVNRITVARADKATLAAILKRRLEPVGDLWIAERCAVLAAKLPDNPPPEPLGAGALHSAKSALLDMPHPMKWRRHFERRSDLSEGRPMPHVNPELLARFARFARDAGEQHVGAHLQPGADDRPVIVRFSAGDLADDFIGAVMGMRYCSKPTGLPDWLHTQKPRIRVGREA